MTGALSQSSLIVEEKEQIVEQVVSTIKVKMKIENQEMVIFFTTRERKNLI